MDLGAIGWVDVDWIDLGQNRDQWRALVNPVNYQVITQLVASRVVLRSIELVS
jgi:hypothetical protein